MVENIEGITLGSYNGRLSITLWDSFWITLKLFLNHHETLPMKPGWIHDGDDCFQLNPFIIWDFKLSLFNHQANIGWILKTHLTSESSFQIFNQQSTVTYGGSICAVFLDKLLSQLTTTKITGSFYQSISVSLTSTHRRSWYLPPFRFFSRRFFDVQGWFSATHPDRIGQRLKRTNNEWHLGIWASTRQ